MVYQINRLTAKLVFVGLVLGMVCMPMAAYCENVNVYGEGVYADNILNFNIYADISDGAILSFGVKVNYPAGLGVINADKNEADWYFGDSATTYPYMVPEITGDSSTGGEVVIIGGKLDTGSPTSGVSGERILLGSIEFDCTGFPFGHPTSDPSPITLELGRGGNYANFVTATTGDILDASSLFTSVIIAKKGDANLDDKVNTQDMSTVRYTMGTGGIAHLWIDCNPDGRINTQDMSCVRYEMTK